MSSSSADAIRKDLENKILSERSVNERAVESLRAQLEKVYNDGIGQVLESYNRSCRALQAMTDIYPNIPVSAPRGSRIIPEIHTGNLRADITSLEPLDGEAFFAHVSEGVGRCVFEPGTNVFGVRGTFPIQSRYMGKDVREGNIGLLTVFETDTEINLPSIRGEGWSVHKSYNYAQRVYRDRANLIVSYYKDYLEAKERDEDYRVTVFGVTPWRIRKRCDEGVCNIIFENLHEEDTRRYIFITTPSDFFMLRGEFFAVFLTPATKEHPDATIRIESCVSRNTVYEEEREGILNIDCCSTNTRAVIRCGKRFSTDFIILS